METHEQQRGIRTGEGRILCLVGIPDTKNRDRAGNAIAEDGT